MKFLAIDTSGKYLSAAACNGEQTESIFLGDCAMKHSVVLMDKIGEVLARAHMSAGECDFFAAVTGPGSFTGIRIGIATVKGLCVACGKPALGVTSFDCIAYNEESVKTLALVDAGRGECYACGYEGGRIVLAPSILPAARVMELSGEYRLLCAEELPFPCERADPCRGLIAAVKARAAERAPAEELHAVYLRKSSAEENRK